MSRAKTLMKKKITDYFAPVHYAASYLCPVFRDDKEIKFKWLEAKQLLSELMTETKPKPKKKPVEKPSDGPLQEPPKKKTKLTTGFFFFYSSYY